MTTAPPPAGGGLRKVRRAYVQIPSSTIRDKALSFRARGVLAFLIDLPDGWDVRAAWIAEQGTEGREAIETALRELRAAGYYRLERRRLPDGTFTMGTAIAEEPVAEWADAHTRHGGRAVAVAVDAYGRVTELEGKAAGLVAPETGNPVPASLAPETQDPESRSPKQDTDAGQKEGEELELDQVTADASPTLEPPAKACPKVGPHGACGACADDRRAEAAYLEAVTADARAKVAAANELERLRQAERRALADAELGACRLCDDAGTATLVVDGTVATTACLHDAAANHHAVATRRAMRATLAARPRKADTASATPEHRARTRAHATPTPEA